MVSFCMNLNPILLSFVTVISLLSVTPSAVAQDPGKRPRPEDGGEEGPKGGPKGGPKINKPKISDTVKATVYADN